MVLGDGKEELMWEVVKEGKEYCIVRNKEGRDAILEKNEEGEYAIYHVSGKRVSGWWKRILSEGLVMGNFLYYYVKDEEGLRN